MNIRNVQQAMRTYQNINGYSPGRPLDWSEVIGKGRFMTTMPTCPKGGTYTFTKTIPQVGELGCRCSHEDTDTHVPVSYSDW